MNQKNHTWRFDENNGEVHLPDSVLSKIKTLSIKAIPNETGGTLVGYYCEHDMKACITDAFEPIKGAKRKRTKFYRPPDSLDRQLSEIYRKSEGKIYYLGEWHTHPLSSTQPSDQDKRSLTELAKSQDVATDTPILIVLGGDFKKQTEIGCYLFNTSGVYFTENFSKNNIDGEAI